MHAWNARLALTIVGGDSFQVQGCGRTDSGERRREGARSGRGEGIECGVENVANFGATRQPATVPTGAGR